MSLWDSTSLAIKDITVQRGLETIQWVVAVETWTIAPRYFFYRGATFCWLNAKALSYKNDILADEANRSENRSKKKCGETEYSSPILVANNFDVCTYSSYGFCTTQPCSFGVRGVTRASFSMVDLTSIQFCIREGRIIVQVHAVMTTKACLDDTIPLLNLISHQPFILVAPRRTVHICNCLKALILYD